MKNISYAYVGGWFIFDIRYCVEYIKYMRSFLLISNFQLISTTHIVANFTPSFLLKASTPHPIQYLLMVNFFSPLTALNNSLKFRYT